MLSPKLWFVSTVNYDYCPNMLKQICCFLRFRVILGHLLEMSCLIVLIFWFKNLAETVRTHSMFYLYLHIVMVSVGKPISFHVV